MPATIKTHPQTQAYRDGYDAIDWADALQGRYLNPVCMEGCPYLLFDDDKIVEGMIVGGEPLCGYEGPGNCVNDEVAF